ncbi:uncharacterized protein LOC121914462 [Sceloporus undulatus]|uniref:uncharacterized protein LOC121914462 n=1 Tax=Sceloporus undulatus TaxID=8520 RepID=UPI001C4AF466|nr:uncharacterized protein LOC121914462 [Sceloporus undulatus]
MLEDLQMPRKSPFALVASMSLGCNNVKISANLSYVVCDNMQNLSLVNRTFIVQALEFSLRKRANVSLNVARVLVSQVDAEELEAALEEFNTKIVNSSLISHNWKEVILRALWDERLRNEDRFNETEFVTAWFQRRLRLFISAISTDMLQCLHNETMQCDQYQAIVKGLDAEFTKMSLSVQTDILHSFQIPYLKGLDSDDSSLRCYSSNASFSAFLEESLQSFGDLLTLRDLETLVPTSKLHKFKC